MSNLLKRIKALELQNPHQPAMNFLGELYAWLDTPEGKAEMDKLYDENRCIDES